MIGKIIPILLLLMACDHVDRSLHVVNMRSDSIAVFLNAYPPVSDFNLFVAPKDTGYAEIVNDTWREAIRSVGSVRLIIFPADSVDRYGRPLHNDLRPIYSATFTLNTLDSLNWTITVK